MSQYLIQDSTLSGIASAIRTRAGVSSTFTPAQMASAILSIPSAHTVDVTLSENGIYLPEDYNADAFEQVNVMVPEPSMSAVTISSNGVYRPSSYGADAFSQVTVNVSGGGGGTDTKWKDLLEGGLSTVYDASVSYIASNAFYRNVCIKEATFDAVTEIGENAFTECQIETVSMPLLNNIPSDTFFNCGSLVSAYFSIATAVGVDAFRGAQNLYTVTIPEAQQIDSRAFYGCYSLSEIDIPYCTHIFRSAFRGCTDLAGVSVPMCEEVWDEAFYDCQGLTQLVAPMLSLVSVDAFHGCTSLSMVSIGQICVIGAAAFEGCDSLADLYLTGSSVCNLMSYTAFVDTPFRQGYGSIHVPASLYSDYINHSVWAVYSSRFVSIP